MLNEQRLADQAYLLDRVEFDPFGGCWLWAQNIDREGYGLGTRRYRSLRVHRLSYEAFNGAIPKGLQVCHRCDIPGCVNPGHLFLGTQQDNIDDKTRKGRGAGNRAWGLRSTCARGHLITPETTYLRRDGTHECRTCRSEAEKARKRGERPIDQRLVNAWIAGFQHGVGRAPWDDMHDYAALEALAYVRGSSEPQTRS